MNILQEAQKLVEGDRTSQYGHFKDNFTNMSIMVSSALGKEVTPEECAMFMVMSKLSRQSNKHKRDNLVDACGYLHILNELIEGK